MWSLEGETKVAYIGSLGCEKLCRIWCLLRCWEPGRGTLGWGLVNIYSLEEGGAPAWCVISWDLLGYRFTKGWGTGKWRAEGLLPQKLQPWSPRRLGRESPALVLRSQIGSWCLVTCCQSEESCWISTTKCTPRTKDQFSHELPKENNNIPKGPVPSMRKKQSTQTGGL